MVSYQANQPPRNPAKGDLPANTAQHATVNQWLNDEENNVWKQEPASSGDNTPKTDPRKNNTDDIPSILRPGFGNPNHQPDYNVWQSHTTSKTPEPTGQDDIPQALKPTVTGSGLNPFRTGSTPAKTPPHITVQSPTDSFASLSINQASNNPWGASLLTQAPDAPKTVPQLLPEATEQDPWATQEPIEMDATPIQHAVNVPGNLDGSAAWTEQANTSAVPTTVNQTVSTMSPEAKDMLREEHQVWGDAAGAGKKTKGKRKDDDSDDEWNMIDSETSSIAPDDEFKDAPTTQAAGKQKEAVLPAAVPFTASSTAATSDTTSKPFATPVSRSEDLLIEGLEETLPTIEQQTGVTPASPDVRPALPPRDSAGPDRWVPTRQAVDGKAETYQVKNIRWHDVNARKNPRSSPILIQNENGPCPLVALVNALTLTTPEDVSDTALVHTLKSRETVSLSLVLDAVFDELMSPRRTSSEDALPDVTELYGFLQSLHTGMNVNPRFIPTPEMIAAYKRSSLTHLHPSQRELLMPGTFENSLEMRLYATFSIPLIHGWLARKTDPAYEAFERQAATYEDAQNLLFREEELDHKLSAPGQGLSPSEQQLYHDIMTIKMFMTESATQLTGWGIEVIGKAIRPGTFAILFRNDHFSTLYCHPQTMQLMTLVTDAGYRSHDEVVWETLADVNGERTEMLSGDFRPVGSSPGVGGSSSSTFVGDDAGGMWTTVQKGKRGKAPQQSMDAPATSQEEQEDRDLALALQLQEEEEEREREERERRRQETLLSEQFIEQQAQQPQPVNRHGRRRSSNNNSFTPPNLSSNTVNIPITGSGRPSNSSTHSLQRPLSGQPAPQPVRMQEVRPLVPPRRPGVHRPEDPSEEAPPSYEQSAHDRTYAPPSNPPPSGLGGPPPGPPPGRMSQAPGVYQRPMGGRTPAMLGSASSAHLRDRDRDCVVM